MLSVNSYLERLEKFDTRVWQIIREVRTHNLWMRPPPGWLLSTYVTERIKAEDARDAEKN